MSDTAQPAPSPLPAPPSQAPAAIVSAIILLTFSGLVFALLFRAVPQESETALKILVGFLGGMAQGVVWYWTGSSIGSKGKDHIIATMAAGGSS